jgi:hypothetical protein
MKRVVEMRVWQMEKTQTEKTPCPLQLSGQNPMYYCRACHTHGICNGCCLSLLLSDGSFGRGHQKKQYSNGDKVIAGNNLIEEESKEGRRRTTLGAYPYISWDKLGKRRKRMKCRRGNRQYRWDTGRSVEYDHFVSETKQSFIVIEGK